ncbi:hypothetical protein K490DRAFT_64702 [Saccharata proteae CBS 121410]|uniref:Uncharacterized protein n=1 Tax=Saccharata proteae CBS 121410 TaxID=1314787 RepID=A0A9P4HV73_9PEZI|nr:hypothetical protein K490DRAFT_64702 [Saccharata proteae CBS 121410]
MVLVHFDTATTSGNLALNPSDLPCPTLPHEIASFPITPSHTNPAFNPQKIADLMLQLLSINWQMGMLRRFNDHSPPSIVQLSPSQCESFLALSRKDEHPFDDAVLEAMCLLPYSTDTNEQYKIAPSTMLIQAPEADQEAERDSFLGGPRIPAHMLRLTEWWGGDSGMAVFVNTRTGMGMELEDYEGDNGEEATVFSGKERPIEELLGEWIERFLRLEWVPDGSLNVAAREDRSVEYIRHRELTERYGWPDKFPLPEPEFEKFLEEKEAIGNEYMDGWDGRYQLQDRLNHLFSRVWEEQQNAHPGERWRQDQRQLLIEQDIGRIFHSYERYSEDENFSAEAGVDVEAELPQMRSINAGGDDWHVELAAVEIYDYFVQLLEKYPEEKDDTTEKMRVLLKEAYDRGQETEASMTRISWGREL